MLPPPILLTVLSFLPWLPHDLGAQQDAGSIQLAPSPKGHPSTPYLGPNIPQQRQNVCRSTKGYPCHPAELRGAKLQEDNVSLFSAFRKWFMGHN